LNEGEKKMKRLLCVSLMLSVLCVGAAFGAADDFVMGNYEGTLSSTSISDAPMRAQVVALGGNNFRAVLLFDVEGDEARLELKGKERPGTRGDESKDRKKALRAAVIDFKQELDAGYDLGGTYDVDAEITKETFTGSFDGAEEDGKFKMTRVFLEPPTRGQKPPAGATVLIDMNGKGASAWNIPPRWVEDGGARSMHISGGSMVSKEEFPDAQYHIEFMCPFMPGDRNQGRGNSGVYVLGRYEVQVLDSFGDLPADNLCGGIYKKATPVVCASLPPLQYQTYDITFKSAKLDGSGKKTADARITVVHNGITIHDDVALSGPTPGGVSGEDGKQGPLLFQDHSDKVEWRNVWVKPLD
jgi:hypothetical protein